MALRAELDKTQYQPGDVMTLTVTTAEGERDRDKEITAHVQIEGVGETDVTGTINLPAAAIVVTDASRVWQKQSDDGDTAVYTATA